MSVGLNKAQSEAVNYVDGPCLVLAGAGSGKTRVITQKIAHLIQNKGVSAKNIAAVTFTNKAAKEMEERAAKLLHGNEGKGLLVCTFHSLGIRILREEHKHAGL
ncbi:MAG: ATP-dependent DNA helicase Rep, partial [Sutterellaceae bacterium]|nr:ATP-dependent DNA helicase Rep [Sutterellaceae bacterium]